MLKGFVSGEEKDIKRIPMKGKNLFDGSTIEVGGLSPETGNEVSDTSRRRSGFIAVNSGTTYSISREITSSGSYFWVIAYDNHNEIVTDATYSTYSGVLVEGNSKSDDHWTFTTTQTTKYIRWYVTANNSYENIMLNLGSTPLPYEPYGYQEGWEVRDNQDRLIWGREDELQTATGTLPFKGYGLPVKVKSLLGNAVQNGTPSPGPVNPNLADPSKTVPGYQESNGSIHAPSSANEITTDFIPFTNTLYILISGSANGDMNYAAYNANKQIIGIYNTGFTPNTVITANPQSYTGAAYLRASWTHGVDQPICITTEQTSTFIPFDPNPPGPVIPEMCGVRTGNLCPVAQWTNDQTDTRYPFQAWLYAAGTTEYKNISSEGRYSLTVTGFTSGRISFKHNGASNDLLIYKNDYSFDEPVSITISFYVEKYDPREVGGIVVRDIMLNLGSTALPYEHYGWKIPFENHNVTLPVYLGEVPTVRRIKKVVFTGQETWTEVYPGEPEAQGIVMYATSLSEIGTDRNDFRCSHFFVGNYRGYLISGQGRINGTSTSAVPEAFNVNYNNGSGGLQNFKEWLASEYAAGHPVTLWYALATEQTSVVNEPLCKIATYADELNSTVATLPEIPTTTGQNTLTVDTNLAPSKLEVSVHAKKIHYGFKIDKSNDNSESAVIYTHDAVTMTPAHMDFTNDRFDYGSWANAFFVRDCYPVALNLDGTIAYRLDPDDYTKKMDGTPSDIFYELLTAEPSDWSTQWKQYYTKDANDNYELNSQGSAPTFAQDTYYKLTYNSSFTGNFMMAFPKVWFYRHEDSQYNYIEISNYKLSDDWKCYAHINASGQEVDFIYLPLFKGVIKSSKLRSLPGQIPQGNTTATDEVNAATALGSRWQIWDHSSVELINDLLILMSKSIDSQGKFGKGRESGYNSSDTVTYGKLQTGTLVKGGKFKGFSSSYKEVKVFGIEGFWANRWDRLQGMLLVDNVWKIKMTPPYNFTGTDFVTLSNAEVPSGNGYLSKVQTSQYGSIPASIEGGSSSKFYKDYFYKTATSTRVARRGGACNNGSSCGFRYVDVVYTASTAAWSIGASPLYK